MVDSNEEQPVKDKTWIKQALLTGLLSGIAVFSIGRFFKK